MNCDFYVLDIIVVELVESIHIVDICYFVIGLVCWYYKLVVWEWSNWFTNAIKDAWKSKIVSWSKLEKGKALR